MKAVIDCLEGDFAVVLFGDEEIKVDIPRKLLPKGAREGSWLKVNIELIQKGKKDSGRRLKGF